MNTTVTLSAESDYNSAGKQYIARITGRDPKFTFAREFVGRKSGKRNDSTSFETDECGLYITVDVTSRGKDETFFIVYEIPESGLTTVQIDTAEAMILANRIATEPLNWTYEAIKKRILVHETAINSQCEAAANKLLKLPIPQWGLSGEQPRRTILETLKKVKDNFDKTKSWELPSQDSNTVETPTESYERQLLRQALFFLAVERDPKASELALKISELLR